MLHVRIGKLIKESETIAITSHISPDGDSLGSALALYDILSSLNKKVEIFIDDDVPDRFSFLPNFNVIKKQPEIQQYDLLFVLDCGDVERVGKISTLINSSQTTINLDHHITNTMFGNINIVDTNSSSTGELLYEIIKINGLEISKDCAICLYTSILTDTGAFKYSNTTSSTLSTAGDLINTGINFTAINNILFDRKTPEQIKLLSLVTSTLEIFKKGKVAMMNLNLSMLEKSGTKSEDADGFSEMCRDIDSVEVGIFIKEKSDYQYKVSMRSKQYIDVSVIAKKFGGGGHKRAAGFSTQGDFDEIRKNILDEINL